MEIDKDYVVKDGEVEIVDEFTRRYVCRLPGVRRCRLTWLPEMYKKIFILRNFLKLAEFARLVIVSRKLEKVNTLRFSNNLSA